MTVRAVTVPGVRTAEHLGNAISRTTMSEENMVTPCSEGLEKFKKLHAIKAGFLTEETGFTMVIANGQILTRSVITLLEECTKAKFQGIISGPAGSMTASFLIPSENVAQSYADRIRAWNHEDVRDLLDLVHGLIRAATNNMCDCKAYGIDITDLPSEIIPPSVSTGFPIWALDKKGMCLTGEALDDITPLSEIIDHYKEEEEENYD